MNLGIFIESFTDEYILPICNLLKTNKFKDKCLFISEVGREPKDLNCAIFNSTEIPFFTGKLLITNMDGAKFCSSINTNAEMYYLYEHDANLFSLLSIYKKIKIIVKTQYEFDEVKRKLAITPILIDKIEDFENVR